MPRKRRRPQLNVEHQLLLLLNYIIFTHKNITQNTLTDKNANTAFD